MSKNLASEETSDLRYAGHMLDSTGEETKGK